MSAIDAEETSQDHMRFPDTNRMAWLKTTRNYLVSEAYELKHFLPWAESVQSRTITDVDVGQLSQSSVQFGTEPLKLSLNL